MNPRLTPAMYILRVALTAILLTYVIDLSALAEGRKQTTSTQITIKSQKPDDVFITVEGDSKFTLTKGDDKKTATLGIHRFVVSPPKGFVFDRNRDTSRMTLTAGDLTKVGAAQRLYSLAAEIKLGDIVPANQSISTAVEALMGRKQIVGEQILNLTRAHRALLNHQEIEKGLTGKTECPGAEWVKDDKGNIVYAWEIEVSQGKFGEQSGKMVTVICSAQLQISVAMLAKESGCDLFTTEKSPGEVVAATTQATSNSQNANGNTTVQASNSVPFANAFAGGSAGPGVDFVTGLGFSKVGPASVTGVVISFDKKGNEAPPFNLARRLGIIGGYSAGSRPMAFIGPAMRVADNAHIFGGLGFGSSGRESVTFGITISLNGAIGKVTGNEEPKKETESVEVTLVAQRGASSPVSSFISSGYSTVILVSAPGSTNDPVVDLKAGAGDPKSYNPLPWLPFGAGSKPRKVAVVLFDEKFGEKLQLIGPAGALAPGTFESTIVLGPTDDPLILRPGKLVMIEIPKFVPPANP